MPKARERAGVGVARRLTSVAELLTYLEQDPGASKQFAKNPTAFLRKRGYPPSVMDTGLGDEKLQKAQKVLDVAKLEEKETLTSALPKLSKAAARVFGSDYRVDIEPFAINFLEHPKVLSRFRWTITGRIRCTWDGWDGCSIGLDW